MEKYSIAATFWTHLVPIAFFLGAAGLIGSALIEVGLGIQGFLSPRLSVGVGLAYVGLGSLYEWTIQVKQTRTSRVDRGY